MRSELFSTDHKSNNFDLIRITASIQVVIVHLCDHLGAPKSVVLDALGFFPGVPVFFFVSGFLVSQSLERSTSLLSFYRNRILRVYPGLLACFAFSLTLASVFQDLPWASPEFAAWIVAQTTIGQFFNPSFMRAFGLGVLNGSLWTIPVELQFYAALPLIYALGQSLGPRSFGGITAAGLLIHGAFLAVIYGTGTMFAKMFQVSLLPWLGFFLVGVLAQQNWTSISWAFRGKAGQWLIIYAAVATLAYHFAPFNVTGNHIPSPVALVLFGLVLSGAFTAPRLSERILRGNDISFGLYLYHGPLINAYLEITEVSRDIPPLAGGFALFFLTASLAAISWTFIERPALALKRRFVTKGLARQEVGDA